jgi:hypothetical protein
MVTAAYRSRTALRPATLTRGTNQQETNLATLKIDGEDRMFDRDGNAGHDPDCVHRTVNEISEI